jgi:hypothetical protein
VWSFPDGKYSSVIAADGMLVIAGFGNLYVLRPVGRSPRPAAAPAPRR